MAGLLAHHVTLMRMENGQTVAVATSYMNLSVLLATHQKQPAARSSIPPGRKSQLQHQRNWQERPELVCTLGRQVGQYMNGAVSILGTLSQVKSHMVKHWMLDHTDLVHMPEFRFTIQSQHRDALSRQVGEAIAIMHSRDALLNSMTEYMTNCLTRVTIDERDWEKKHREMQEELNEKEELEKLQKFIKEKETAGRNLAKNNEQAEEPAYKRRKVEPEEPSPQSPMTITFQTSQEEPKLPPCMVQSLVE